MKEKYTKKEKFNYKRKRQVLTKQIRNIDEKEAGEPHVSCSAAASEPSHKA